jgi:pyruvate formate lyase activating enzyme
MLTRREFNKILLQSFTFLLISSFLPGCRSEKAYSIPGEMASHYKKLKGNLVQCFLCPNECVIPEGERSPCLVRENRKGKLYTLVFGNPCAVHVDPIEKKPLFHVLPASKAFSIATAGCNFHCKNCQNWEISQYPPEKTNNLSYPPEKVVEGALAMKCEVIAYTYTEPVVFYEYMLETAKLAREKGILNSMHTNAYIKEEPLRELCANLQAANVDLKSMSSRFYDEVCDGELKPVLRSLEVLKEEGVYIEVTNLMIPDLNDSPEETQKLCQWIKRNLGEETPLHFSRFYPMYRLKNIPPTPVETLERAREIALDSGLPFAYIGNVPGHPGESTYCPRCGKVLIKRFGFTVEEYHLKKGACAFCGREIPGIWRDNDQKGI